MATVCTRCGVKLGMMATMFDTEADHYCAKCTAEMVDERWKDEQQQKMDKQQRIENLIQLSHKVVVTTTPGIDGYKVTDYLGIESVEFVIGTGLFSEITTDIQDLFGARSSAFEQKLSAAKKQAMDTLKFRAVEKGANAVVAIDIDYTEFSGNRIALIINGTLVSVVPVEAVAPISQQRDDHVMSAVESPIRASQNEESDEVEDAKDNPIEQVSEETSQSEAPEVDEEEDATQMFAQARQYAQDGDHQHAISILQEIVSRFPQTQTADKSRRSLRKSGITT